MSFFIVFFGNYQLSIYIYYIFTIGMPFVFFLLRPTLRMPYASLFRVLLWFITCCFPIFSVLAQKKSKDKNVRDTNISVSDTITANKSEFQIDFVNLYKIPFYFNAAEINQIKKLETDKDFPALQIAMENYVSKFGIQNFSRDIILLWKLGQVYEINKQPEKAAFVYRLALKHIRGKEIKTIQQYYDQSNKNVQVSDYVPLQYYYELVEYRRKVDTLIPPKSVFLNMGELVNDKRYPDYGPTLNIQGSTLIFTKRMRALTADRMKFRENEDLFYTINYDGFWDEALPFAGVINSQCNEGSAIISRDGKTLFFARCLVPEYRFDCQDCMGSCDIYVSYMDNEGKWTLPENLGSNVNSISWDSHPTLSHKEDTLYFASDRIGGFGLSDIWYSVKQIDGTWSTAKNLGPVINTRGNEVSPFYHPLHHVLYFSSNGHLVNFGIRDTAGIYHTYDIYKTRRLQQKWQEPFNIGPLVNGKGDEYYFTIDSKGKDLFYSKSDVDRLENLDLFSFPLPMEAQATSYTKIRGSLKDSLTDDPFKGVVSIIDLSNGIEVAPKYMREDGTFEFDLNNDNEYLLVIQGEDFFRIEHRFQLNNDTTINLRTNSLRYNKWKFQTLEFDNNSSVIKTEMEVDLDKVVDFLVDHPYIKLKISGHTDGSGDPDANLKLSQARADAIKEYVMAKGQISADRIEAIGYGSSKPIVPENTDADKKINRRVEFELIRPSPEELELLKQQNTTTDE